MMNGHIHFGTRNKKENNMIIAILKVIWIPLIIIAVVCGILGCIAGCVKAKSKHLEKELKRANEFFSSYKIENK